MPDSDVTYNPITPEAPTPPPVVIPPPPGFGKQIAQLVIIPAVIVIIALGVMALLGVFIDKGAGIDDQLSTLEQGSGAGRMAFGLQDPRYKDRMRAALNIATQLPSIKDPEQRRHIADRLANILKNNVTDEDIEVQRYLLTAIGQLGQPGGMDLLISKLDSPLPAAREGAIWGILSWPDDEQARTANPALIRLLDDQAPSVRETAAAALGKIAKPTDAGVIAALRKALDATTNDRDVQANVAIALARLGDETGSTTVAGVYLNRDALARQPDSVDTTGSQPMTPTTQDRIMCTVLAAAPGMQSDTVWHKIQELSRNDPSNAVRKAALDAIAAHEKQK